MHATNDECPVRVVGEAGQEGFIRAAYVVRERARKMVFDGHRMGGRHA